MNNRVLPIVRRRLAAWLALRLVLHLAAVVALVGLTFILADAAFDLSEAWRSGAKWVLALAAILVILITVAKLFRLTEPRLAQLFERAQPFLGSRLTNAVQLAQRPAQGTVEEFFRRECVDLGRRTAVALPAWPLVRRSLRLATASALMALVLWGVLMSFAPAMLQAVLPRFRDPAGDHPPYSRLHFEVQPQQAEVRFGGQLEIRATTFGRPVDKLWLVARSATNVTRAMMFLAPDKSFFQSLVNLREPTEFHVTDGQARSYRFPIRIRLTPQITLVELTAEFPSYTSKPARTGRLPDEPQAFPVDTVLAFRVASNRPLKSGTLALMPVLGGKTTTVSLRPDSQQDTIVTGSFVLAEAVAFTLSVRDVDGLDVTEPRRGRLNVAPDERPRLFVLEPGRNAVATPNIRVPVKVQAQDDYGIARVVWLRGFNRSIERPFSMKVEAKSGAQSVESKGAFELSALGVRPGDVIDYYFEAADNYPKGPNVVLSRPYSLEIISEEQYRDILKRAAARKALFEPQLKLDAWLQRLAERARSLAANTAKNDPAAAAEADALSEQLEKYERELSKLMSNPLMFDVEQAFRTTLVAQHTRFNQARQEFNRGKASAGNKPAASDAKKLAEELSRLAQTEQEEVGEPARQLISVIQVVAKADAFVRLAQQQAALAQMLRRFSERTEPLSRIEQMEVQELSHQQRRVQEALKMLVTQLPDLLAKVPNEPDHEALRQDVRGFLQAVEEAKLDQDLNGAASALDKPDTIAGYRLAQRAAEKMDKLIGKCSGLPDQGKQCLTARFQPKLSRPGLGNSVAQIRAAMNSGNGQGGMDGYGLFNEDAALYGPNVELAGEQGGGRQADDSGTAGARGMARVTGESRDSAPGQPPGPGGVRLQPEAKFPLRYREIVGEYFRAIAETSQEGERR